MLPTEKDFWIEKDPHPKDVVIESLCLLQGIPYGERTPLKIIGVDPDNGQGITEMSKVCQKFECQVWHGTIQVAPLLKIDENGFRVCPKCSSSYGRG